MGIYLTGDLISGPLSSFPPKIYVTQCNVDKTLSGQFCVFWMWRRVNNFSFFVKKRKIYTRVQGAHFHRQFLNIYKHIQ